MKDKRIAFYSREFRLCEWPEKPSFDDQLKAWLNNVKIPLCANFNHCHTCRNLSKEHQACPCDEAITSAMENGAAFSDQNAARCRVYDIINRPDGAVGKTTFVGENVWQPKEGDNWPAPEGAEIVEKCQHNGIHNSTCISRKVAIFKSESVEKKEKVVGGEWYICHDPRSGRSYITNINNLSDSELQSIADRLNQSTPKE